MTAQIPSLAGSAGRHWLAPVLEMASLAAGTATLPAPGPAGSPRIATLLPGMDASCAGATRAFTSATLRSWGIADRADDILIVVSELVTNACRHARPATGQAWPPVRLGLLQTAHGLLCAVADPSPRPPVPQEPGPLSESGRGLQVIGALTDGWGYTVPQATGKTVWAMFTATPGPVLPAGLNSWPPLR